MKNSLVRFGWGFLVVMLTMSMMIFTVTDRGIAEEKIILIAQVGDLTGPATSWAGKPFAYGVKDYFNLVNEKGGISGRKLKHMLVDGGYSVAGETAAFKQFSMQDIVVFIDWSTGGALQIAPMCSEKKIVNFGGAPLEFLSDMVKYPYRFIHSATYEQCWRAVIHYHMKKHPGKKQTAALTYPDSGFGRVNADAIKAYLKKMDIPVVDEEIVDFKALDATTQMLKMKRSNPDFVLNAQVEPSIAVIMKDAKRVGIDTQKTPFYAPLNALGQEMPKLGGDAVRSLIFSSPFSDVSEADLPGIKQILEFNAGKEWQPSVWYVHGWTAAAVISEGLKRVVNRGEAMTGENLKKALEALKGFDNGGLTSLITFTPSNHIGAYGVKLFRPDFNKMKGVVKSSDWIYPE